MEKIYIYPSCSRVSGYSRGIIQDFNLSKYTFVPIWIISLFEKKNYITIKEFGENLKKYGEESQLDFYLNFLIENEIVYKTNKDIKFQENSLVFESPSIFTNSIIIYKDFNFEKLRNLISELEDFGCENVQIYFSEIENITVFSDILSIFDDSIVQCIEIITNYSFIFYNLDEIIKLFSDNKRLFTLHLTKAPEDKKIFVDVFHIKYIIFSTENFNFKQCGEVHPLFFKNNLPFFTESQQHNTCLNRKICIDVEGNIKNCPNMQENYGNIADTTLAEAIEKQGFKDYWYICK
ncbi:MAG: hypothetical protein LBV69_07270, partial [Bacteroidales bacterium]|nr:hypothetical protein [Bacteroidales bacterium]